VGAHTKEAALASCTLDSERVAPSTTEKEKVQSIQEMLLARD